MKYSYENSKTVKNEFLKNVYFLPELKIIKNWYNIINKLFNGISSSDGEIEHSIFKTLVYLFIISFFLNKILMKQTK